MIAFTSSGCQESTFFLLCEYVANADNRARTLFASRSRDPGCCPVFVLTDRRPGRYTPRQIALLPGDAQHLVVVEADHNEFNQTESEVRGAQCGVHGAVWYIVK